MALAVGACFGQPLYVAAPDVTPLPYGLFSIANIQTGSDPHWQQGVEYEPQPCGPASVYACPTCEQTAVGTQPTKTYESGVDLVQSFPFTVYGTFKCSPVGSWERGYERALEALENGEERAVEKELALGNAHSSNYLTSTSTVDITPTPGTPVTIVQGIALLEQYVGSNGAGSGAILISRRDAVLANSNGYVICEHDEVLSTCIGTPVAAMSGFDFRAGPSADAAPAGDAWIFGIGAVPQILRSEPFMVPGERRDALNTGTNDFEVLAERTYSVTWPCVTAGVLVSSIGS